MFYTVIILIQKRKDCVTILNIILEILLKWFAPILVFTTEEIYSLVSKDKESIHEKYYEDIPGEWKNEELNSKWNNLFYLKQDANIAIEEKRAQKIIGSSLEAELTISVGSKNYNLLDGLDLEEYFITSKVEIIKLNDKDGLKINVQKAKGTKCPRCWKILESSCNRCEAAQTS